MVEQITQLKLSTIVKNPYQPRLVFDEDKLKELANSIQENGVLQLWMLIRVLVCLQTLWQAVQIKFMG